MRYLLLIVTGLAGLAGCAPAGGWIVKPIDTTRGMTEKLLQPGGFLVAEKIAVIPIDGVLTNTRSKGLFSKPNPVSQFVERMNHAQADPNVKAVVLRINSPGGGVTASDIMYSRLMRLRKARRIPVVAIFEDVGASGAYYIACGADEIIAHPSSVTGSIGVLAQTISVAEALDFIGITTRAVTSGPRKDMLSPLKPLDDKDLAILQDVVDELYEQFVKVVIAGRKLDPKTVRTLADGRIYTATQALDNGLIDRIGYMPEAIASAARLAGVNHPKVIMYDRPWGYRPHAYSQIVQPAQMNLVNITIPEATDLTRPRLMYLWTGRQ